MDDSENVFSDRTLRYGRNINFICFIALAMILYEVKLDDANLFGAKPKAVSDIWSILFVLLGYHVMVFYWNGWIDWKNWLRRLQFSPAEFIPNRDTDILRENNELIRIYSWTLFINKKLVAWEFLNKGHKAVTLYDHVLGDIYAWLITHDNKTIIKDQEAFAIKKEVFKTYRSNYWRCLIWEFGFPTGLFIWATWELAFKIHG